MNNLFPGSYGPPSNSVDPISMMNQIYPWIQENRNQQYRLQNDAMNKQHINRLAEIAAMNVEQNKQQSQKPMNTVYQQNISDLDKAKLALTARGLDIRDEANRDRADVQGRREDIRANLAGLHDLPDSAKIARMNDARTALQQLKGTQASEMLNTRGTQRMGEIGARGNERRSNIEATTEGHLKEIGARTAGQKDIKEMTMSQMSPAAQSTDEKNRAKQLVVTNPEMAQHIIFDEKGNWSINPNTDLATRSAIAGHIYNTAKDIELPSDTVTKDDTKKKTKESPKSDKNSDPLNLRGSI